MGDAWQLCVSHTWPKQASVAQVPIQQHVFTVTSYSIFNIRVCNQRWGTNQIFPITAPRMSTAASASPQPVLTRSE